MTFSDQLFLGSEPPCFLRAPLTSTPARSLLYLHASPLPSKSSVHACWSHPPDEEEQEQVRPNWDPNVHSTIWKKIEILGLIDRYESIIASVGYEYIEEHVLKTCTGEWTKPMLEDLRVWMSEKVVPWMLHVYARGASNRTYYFLFFLMSYNVSDDRV